MSHRQQLDFVGSVRAQSPKFFQNTRVLEVGSLNINGTVRQFFVDSDYTGIDVGPGPGVDVVVQGQDFDGADDSYDVTISCECFEHNPYWIETFHNMIRMTKPNGLVLMTCATLGRAEHGTARTSPHDSPLTVGQGWDYYKNLTELDFRSHVDFDSVFHSYEFSTNIQSSDLYFWGIKLGA